MLTSQLAGKCTLSCFLPYFGAGLGSREQWKLKGCYKAVFYFVVPHQQINRVKHTLHFLLAFSLSCSSFFFGESFSLHKQLQNEIFNKEKGDPIANYRVTTDSCFPSESTSVPLFKGKMTRTVSATLRIKLEKLLHLNPRGEF